MQTMDSRTDQAVEAEIAMNKIRSDPITHAAADTKLLVVVERQDFARGCLTSWIKTACQEFGASGVADVAAPSSEAALARADVVVVHVSGAMPAEWLERQAAWLRADGRDVPVVAIVDPGKAGPVADIVTRFRLQGYIPTSSSVDVAASNGRADAAGMRRAGASGARHVEQDHRIPAEPVAEHGQGARPQHHLQAQGAQPHGGGRRLAPDAAAAGVTAGEAAIAAAAGARLMRA